MSRYVLLFCGALLCLAWSPLLRSETPSFANFDHRALAGETLNVVFFGGSLTWGAQATDPQLTSYRANMGRAFEERYPKARFHFWDAAIGGTGSQLGAFRLDRDVLARKPDLVFLDFTVNDGPYDPIDPDKLAAYESLIRRMAEARIPVVQVIFALKKDMPPNIVGRRLDAEHKKIAAAYNVPIADTIPLMRAEVESGHFTPDQLWPMAPDETHPGDEGYVLYARAAWDAYEKAVENKIVCSVPEQSLHADTYLKAKRHELAALPRLAEGWKPGLPNRGAITHDFMPSRWMDRVVVAKGSEAAPLVFQVKARNISLFGEATPKSGKLEVWLDGQKIKTLAVNAQAGNGNLRYFENLAMGLDPDQEHRLELKPILQAGEEIRIESLCLAGGAATLESPASP